ncbi:hypothetical protein Tco_0832227 [Tanacetum coccineum]
MTPLQLRNDQPARSNRTLEANSRANRNIGLRNGNDRGHETYCKEMEEEIKMEITMRMIEMTIGTDVAFAMSWRELMKLIAKVYCPRTEIQKIETELWNLTVKNNDLAAYT